MTVNVTIGDGVSTPEVNSGTSGLQAPSLHPPEPIAVVGMACRLPGDVHTPSALWELLASKKSTFGPVPDSRFTHSSFYHPLGTRPGSLNIPGGHFLSQSLGAFDASFFSITPFEANSIDPQQRILLEVTWECLESAGIAPETLEGKNVGVYVGAWTCDYETIQKSDIEGKGASESVWITGTGPAILSNRVSYVYNLRGPSMTIDTGCSASAMALHVACQALRDKAAQVHSALVGATNLFITPEIPISMANMGVLSSTGGSKPFDARADGYGRGEGIDCIFLKRLSDALRDGDPIRALIRSSAVNADGRTMGLAAPSALAQEMAIREAYATAGITESEFNQTAFIECHGTGTKAGDPLEAQAIGRVFGRIRRKGDTLYIGSIKPSIGHGEGASAMNSVLKAILSLEAGKIPPNVDFVDPSPKVKFDEWRLNVPTQVVPWPKSKHVKRVSVSSYGYGGANGHIVLDDVESYLHLNARSLGIQQEKGNLLRRKGFIVPHEASSQNNDTLKDPMHMVTSNARPFLLTFSAKSESSLKGYIKRLGTMMTEKTTANSPVDFGLVADLAYTLGVRRSLLPSRTFGVFLGSAEHVQDNTNTNAAFANSLLELATDAKCFQEAQQEPKIGFIFTGQGAQWPRMGVELLKAFPFVGKFLKNLERVLKNLPDAPEWNIRDELERSTDTSKVNDPQFSQVLSTAVQLCLVELLRNWKVLPRAVVGHSSGEIAASYAAGILSSSQAITVAYYRGLVCGQASRTGSGPKGGMLAVGLGKKDAEKWISRPEFKGKVVIACVNSPQSVTISGDSEAIDQLQQLLARSENEIFARRLKVPLAYHSHHMLSLGEQYQERLEQSDPKIIPDVGWVPMFSSVTGDLIEGNELGASYWRRNLESTVFFSDAVKTLLDMTKVDTLIEIGPHSTLSSAIRDMGREIQANKLEYIPSLIRERSASISVLELAGTLYGLGCTELDLEAVNGVETILTHTDLGTESTAPKLQYQSRRVLVDLPSYCWDHSQEYWLETRRSKEWRFRKHPRHDILGSRIPGINIDEPQWMNVLSVANTPWLKQHQVQGRIIFPAAGYISMAIEALTQYLESSEESSFDPNDAFLLREVTIEKPIVFEGTPQGSAGAGVFRASNSIEVFLSLRKILLNKMDESKRWFEFYIKSTNASGTGTTKHCSGLICSQKRRKNDEKPAIFDPEIQKTLRRFTPQIFYEGMKSVGYKYDGRFSDGLKSIKVRSGARELIAEVDLLNQVDVARGQDDSDDQKTAVHLSQESTGGDENKNTDTVNLAELPTEDESIFGKSIGSESSSLPNSVLVSAQSSSDSVIAAQASEETIPKTMLGAEAINMHSELTHHKSFQAETGYSLVQNDEMEQFQAAFQSEATGFDHPESRYVIHPGTIDLTLQLLYFALHDGRISRMEEPIVPIFISELYIAAPSPSTVKLDLHCKVNIVDGLLFPESTWAAFHDTDGQITLYLKGMKGIFLSSMMKNVGVSKKDLDILRLTWHPAHYFINQDNFRQAANLHQMDMPKMPTDMQSLISFVSLVAAEVAHLTQDLEPTEPHLMRFCQYINHILSEPIQEQIRLSCDSVPYLDVLSIDSAKRQSEIEIMAVDLKTQNVRGEMVYLIYKNISSLFCGEIDPFELFQTNSCWPRLMQGRPETWDFLTKNLKVVLNTFPRATILEVGGGTGSNTNDILNSACIDKTEYGPFIRKYDSYTFTDISLAFVSQAKERFSKTYTGMHFQTFDLSKDPIEQGYEAGTYDLVIAVNVLHATADISVSLSHIKSLLRPGGRILLGELGAGCASTIDYPFILGVLSSFWKAEEAHRQLVPLMSEDAWVLALTNAGFTIDYLEDDYLLIDGTLFICASNRPPNISEVTMVPSAHVHVGSDDVTAQLAFQAPHMLLRDHEQPKSPIAVIYGQTVTPTVERIIGLLATNFNLPIVSVSLWSESFIIADAVMVVSLVEVDEPLMLNISETVFARVKSLLATVTSPVLWVTNGVHMAARNPVGALITGLARTARNEHINSQFYLLDLSTNKPEQMAKTITKMLSHLGSLVYLASNDPSKSVPSEAPKTKKSGGTGHDWEFCEYDGLIHVPRIMLDNESKLKYLPQSANHQYKLKSLDENKMLGLTCPHRGILSSLVYEEMESKPLPSDWIEITPLYYGLNFHDIAVVMGFLPAHRVGLECTGRVSKIGSAVKKFKPGDEVYSLYLNGFGNRFQAPAAVCFKCPPNVNLFEFTASLVVYLTVVRALKQVANLAKGEKILIHSAAGGVGIAAINYAKLVGAEIFATCGNDEKRAFLVEKKGISPERIFSSRNLSFREAIMKATGEEGVDVILNSLTGEALTESWKCLAPMGRFIEIGKRDLIQGGKLDLSGFLGNKTYSAIDLSMLVFNLEGLKINVPALTRLTNEFQELYTSGQLPPISPITQFSTSEMEQAFRYMATGTHMGKIVITRKPEEMVKVSERALPVYFDPHATYILIGGLGGIGCNLAVWMAEHTAKHITFLSRSRERASHFEEEHVQTTLAALTSLGCEYQIVPCDVGGDFKEVESTLVSIAKQRKIKGLVHAAMVLKDCLLDKMSYEDFQIPLHSKVYGLLNIQRAFDNHPDLVLTSLDFFVVLSSLSAIVGSAGQANYAAAGTFEDAFVQFRQHKGQVASVIDLGAITNVGYVSRNPESQKFLKRAGVSEVSPRNLYDAFRMAIGTGLIKSEFESESSIYNHENLRGVSGKISSPLDSRKIHPNIYSKAQTMVGASIHDFYSDDQRSWYQDPKWGIIVSSALANAPNNFDSTSYDQDAVSNPFKNIETRPMDDVIKEMTDCIIHKTAQMTMIPPEQIKPTHSLQRYGMDSLVAVELRSWILKIANVEITVAEILATASISGLAEKAYHTYMAKKEKNDHGGSGGGRGRD